MDRKQALKVTALVEEHQILTTFLKHLREYGTYKGIDNLSVQFSYYRMPHRKQEYRLPPTLKQKIIFALEEHLIDLINEIEEI